MGVGEADLERLRARLEDGHADGLWPENRGIVEAFLAISSQWRTSLVPAGLAVAPLWIGLDYASALAGLAAEGIVVTPELWAGIRIMEGEAVVLLNGRRA